MSLLDQYNLVYSGQPINLSSPQKTSSSNNFNLGSIFNQPSSQSTSRPVNTGGGTTNTIGGGGNSGGGGSFSSPGTDTTGGLNPQQPSSLFQQLTNPILNVPAYNAADYQYPDMQKLMKSAYDALAPYYSKLLTEAQGDVNLALQNLQTDYNTGTRYANEDLARTTTQTQENLQGTLESLGLQFTGEKQNLLDTLNKRGMAVTEDPNSPSGLATATQGRGGYEMGLLSQDQQLRQEATQRAAQQTLQNAGVSQQRSLESAQTTLTRGEQSQAQTQRNYQEQLDTQRRQEALQQAGITAQQQLGQQQMDIAKNQAQTLASAASGGGGGGGQFGGYADKNAWFHAKTGGQIAPVGWNG